MCLDFALSLAESMIQQPRCVVQMRLFAKGRGFRFADGFDVEGLGLETYHGSKERREEIGSGVICSKKHIVRQCDHLIDC